MRIFRLFTVFCPATEGKAYVFGFGHFWYVEIEYIFIHFQHFFWFGEKTSVVWNSKICECFGFVLYCIFLVSEQKSNIYFVRWYFAFGNCAGVTGGTASGKTTVCDMIIQQLHDHRVVLVNQVIVITALY